MENKADVKAIMARFQAGGANSTEETPSPAPGRLKTALHPTMSSGPPPQPKKPVSESLSSITIPPKPTYLKSTVSNQSTKSAPEVRETPKTKALASMFANAQEDSNSNVKPLFANKAFPFKPPLSQDAEVKVPMPKPPLHKPSLSSTLPGSKPAFPKPPPGAPSNFKPPWVKEDSGGSLSTSSPTPPKVPPFQLKPTSSVSKLCLNKEDVGGVNMDSTNKMLPTPDSTPNISNFRTTQSIFNKEREKPADPSDDDLKGGGVNKLPLSFSNSTPPDRPPPSKKPSFVRKMVAQSTESNSISEDNPKRNPLPNSLALGPAPAKPNRPPRVNLEGFRGGTDVSNEGPSRKASFPLPPASHPSNHVTPSLTSHHSAPSLPPRHPGAIIQPDQDESDENYDDVGLMTSPPPLPPSTGHPSQRPKSQQEDESDEEMYEDLDERWDATDQKEQEKKRDKDEKEEKRRLELERKEQKEREKKEQDARKKFKLSGPLQVIHKGTARVDSRGGKTDLSLRKGDEVHIIRVMGNPEGKWLGRTQDGSIGYVKTASVEIDFDSLKHQGSSLMTQQDYDPEVYDDIDIAPDNSDNQRLGVFLPPPPEDDGEIYDDVEDPSLNISPSLEPKSSPRSSRGFLRMFERRKPATATNEVPPPSQFSAEGNSDHSGAAVDEEIYDDVDSQIVRPPAPPPLISSLTALKLKLEEMDPKKQKKFEKEERDFRKKFKYDGEIQVLYQVTIISTLSNKKWSGKDLPIKPRETVDVIVKAMDNKLICRNEDGKFGYVSTNHIDIEDGDIYDDIGEDCIYDND